MFLHADAEQYFDDLKSRARNYFQSGNQSLSPLGHDPTFQPASRLWNYDLIAREGEYYNESQVPHETSMLIAHKNCCCAQGLISRANNYMFTVVMALLPCVPAGNTVMSEKTRNLYACWHQAQKPLQPEAAQDGWSSKWLLPYFQSHRAVVFFMAVDVPVALHASRQNCGVKSSPQPSSCITFANEINRYCS